MCEGKRGTMEKGEGREKEEGRKKRREKERFLPPHGAGAPLRSS